MSGDEEGYIRWRSHYNKFLKIRFRVHPEILTSDEAIVAVFTHEMYELSQLRRDFAYRKRWRMWALDYATQVLKDFPGNYHDVAWEKADEAVLERRKKQQ